MTDDERCGDRGWRGTLRQPRVKVPRCRGHPTLPRRIPRPQLSSEPASGPYGQRGNLAESWVAFGKAAQQVELGADVRRAHERFADQDGPNAGGLQEANVLMCANAAFADQAAMLGNSLGNLDRVFQPGFKRAKIAIVHPNNPGAAVDHRLQIVGVVQLDERMQAEHGLHQATRRALSERESRR